MICTTSAWSQSKFVHNSRSSALGDGNRFSHCQSCWGKHCTRLGEANEVQGRTHQADERDLERDEGSEDVRVGDVLQGGCGKG